MANAAVSRVIAYCRATRRCFNKFAPFGAEKASGTISPHHARRENTRLAAATRQVGCILFVDINSSVVSLRATD